MPSGKRPKLKMYISKLSIVINLETAEMMNIIPTSIFSTEADTRRAFIRSVGGMFLRDGRYVVDIEFDTIYFACRGNIFTVFQFLNTQLEQMVALEAAVDIDDNGVGNGMSDTVRGDSGVRFTNAMAETALLAGTKGDNNGKEQ